MPPLLLPEMYKLLKRVTLLNYHHLLNCTYLAKVSYVINYYYVQILNIQCLLNVDNHLKKKLCFRETSRFTTVFREVRCCCLAYICNLCSINFICPAFKTSSPASQKPASITKTYRIMLH